MIFYTYVSANELICESWDGINIVEHNLLENKEFMDKYISLMIPTH
jgi:hypothetical protein